MRNQFLPLTTLALSIDLFWSIEPGWAMRAKSVMDTIDVGQHTVEYAARATRRSHSDPDAYEDDEEPRERKREEKKPYNVIDGVAYLYLTGPLTKRPQSWGGGTSTILFRRNLRMAVSDEAVKSILIIIDSPGGQVSGTCDAAADVAWASKRKPVATLCEDQCCSAAYWIGCQAAYGMFCNPTATVGSIGTITVLEDSSEAAAEAGITMHVIATGDRKGIGVPGAPVTEEQIAYVHDYLDLMNAEFTGAVKRSRKLSAAAMKEITRAGIYVGAQAVTMGLCSAVKSLDEVHAMLVGADGKASARYAPLSDGEDEPVAPPQSPPATDASNTISADFDDVPTGTQQAVTVPTATTTPTAPGAGIGQEIKMKEKLVRALSMLGLQRMAVAVVGAADDSPETMAQAMSSQVNAEVDERVANHPLVMQCGAVGIATANDFATHNEMAILGMRYLAQLRSDAKAQAIRAFGAETGPGIGAQVDNMPHNQVKALLAAWQTQADATFGHGKDGSAPARASAPGKVNESVPATAGAEDAANEPKSHWDKLNATQQEYGKKLGMNTTEKREEWAKAYLEAAAGNGLTMVAA